MELLVCQGQSMFPTIKNGDKILLKNLRISEIRPYPIVVYKNQATQVCHRVFKIKNEDGRKFFYTKGDFNPFFTEKVGESDILGKVIGVYRKGKFNPLLIENSVVYYIFTKVFSFLKEVLKIYLGKIYNFYALRWFIKIIAPLKKDYFSISLAEDRDDFKSFYNVFPFCDSQYQIELRLLAKYKNYAVGKLWVLKDRKTGMTVIYGPYVKLLYRARYIGRGLIEKTIDILKNNLHLNYAQAIIPFCEKPLIPFYDSFGFIAENPAAQDPKGLLLMRKDLSYGRRYV
jgi:signal peptidase I